MKILSALLLLSIASSAHSAEEPNLRGISNTFNEQVLEAITINEDNNPTISCIQPRNKLRIMDIIQACDGTSHPIPYDCDDGEGICCKIEHTDDPDIFNDVDFDNFGTCHRLKEEEKEDDYVDPWNQSCDPANNGSDCYCPGGYPNCDTYDPSWCTATEGMGCCTCAMPGRPFVDASGKMLAALPLTNIEGGVDSKLLWSLEEDDEDTTPSSFDNSTSSIAIKNQRILGEEWTKNALGEHSSIASFAAFSIALMTNSAPSDLVTAALIAGLDEARHAKTSFAIASKLTGKKIEPGPLPPSNHQFNHDLTALAIAVAKEGCVGETLSALELAAEVQLIDTVLKNEEQETGTKYDGIDTETLVWIRNEMHTIALEESTHAALAWRTVDWVCGVDSDVCDVVKESVLSGHMLDMAFDRRFASLSFGGVYATLKDAWKEISSHRADAGSSLDVCMNDNDMSGGSLIMQMAKKVTRSRSIACMN